MQDRVAARDVIRALHLCYRRVSCVWADSAYTGTLISLANALGIVIHIVTKLAGQIGFQVLPRRWVVERSFAWLGRNRRLAKAFEATTASATAWVLLANLRLLTRRLARADRQ